MELHIDGEPQSIPAFRTKDMNVGQSFRRIQAAHRESVFIRAEISTQMVAWSKDSQRQVLVCNLMTGRVYCMSEDEQVIPVNAKIRISAHDYNKQP